MMRYISLAILGTTLAICARTYAAEKDNATLAGRVTDADGLGVSAQVTIYQMMANDGQPYLRPRCIVKSDDEGRYACAGLPEGRFLIRERAVLSEMENKGEKRETALSLFYPGVPTLAEAEPITVVSGGGGWAEIRISTLSQASLSGRLIPRAPDAALTLRTTSDGLSLDTGARIEYDGATGAFKVKSLPPGHYLLEADWLVDDAEHRASIPVDLGDDPVKDLKVSALANVAISGHITNGVGFGPISKLYLRRIDAMIPVLTAIVKGNAFQFPDVPAGEYLMELRPGSNEFIASLSIDGKEVEGQRFIAGDEISQTVGVTLCGPAFKITGSVSPWDTAATVAEVVAISENDGSVYQSVTDEQHRFSIGGLAPGSYRLFAWATSESVPYRTASVRRKFQKDGTEVSIEEGSGSEPVDLSPIETY